MVPAGSSLNHDQRPGAATKPGYATAQIFLSGEHDAIDAEEVIPGLESQCFGGGPWDDARNSESLLGR